MEVVRVGITGFLPRYQDIGMQCPQGIPWIAQGHDCVSGVLHNLQVPGMAAIQGVTYRQGGMSPLPATRREEEHKCANSYDM